MDKKILYSRVRFRALASPLVFTALLLFVGANARISTARGEELTKADYVTKMSRVLEEIRERSLRWQRGKNVALHANLFLAHEAFISSTPLPTLLKAVDAFAEARFAQVDLNIGLFPWRDGDQAAIAKYDAIVMRIRERGMRVAMNPQYSPVRHTVKDFGEWEARALPVFREVVTRYKPEVFVVVHEPTTMSKRFRSRANVREWTAFAQKAAALVKAISPQTRVGAGGLASEERFFESFARVKELDVLTLDIYNLKDFPTYGRMIRKAKRAKKPVYIEETWRPVYLPSSSAARGQSLEKLSTVFVGDPAFESVDIKWLQALLAWGAAQNVEAVTPVWMQTFFAYGGDGTAAFDAGYLDEVKQAIDIGKRTALYRALVARAQ